MNNFKHRGINGDDITKILFQDVVLAKSPDAALRNLLKLSGIKRYVSTLATDHEKQDFVNHMQRYINIWLPECVFEVSFTNRYMIDQWEARTTARKYIKAGDKIKYLAGNLVSIPIDEEDDELFTSNAFSITYSSRKKTKSLFLGPARFANHDCDANAKLDSRGNEGMVVIAIRDIAEGDEITVKYGENYFGEDNCECLCSSCEKKVTGGWRPRKTEGGELSTPRAGSVVDDEDPGSRRSKRKRQKINYSQKIRGAVNHHEPHEEQPPSKRRKTDDVGLLGLFETTAKKITNKKIKQFHDSQSPAKKSAIVVKRPPGISDPRNLSIWAQIGHTAPFRRATTSLRPPFGRPRLLSVSSDGRRSFTPTRHSSTPSRTSSTIPGQSKSGSLNSRMLFSFLKREPVDETEDRKLESFPAHVVASVESEDPKSLSSSNEEDETSVFDHAERQTGSPLTEPSVSNARRKKESIRAVEADEAADDEKSTLSLLNHVSSKISRLSQAESPSIEATVIHPSPPVTPESEKVLASSGAMSQDPNIPDLIATINPDGTVDGTIDCLDTTPMKAGLAISTSTETPVIEPSLSKSASPTPSHAASTTSETSETEPRYPGDYIRTTRLLGSKNSRWVECRTCDDHFVQQDGNQTRRECPRCERHSKMYGFQWPQVDYVRGGPERVMDHRTVNRFLSHAEELKEPKRFQRRRGGREVSTS